MLTDEQLAELDDYWKRAVEIICPGRVNRTTFTADAIAELIALRAAIKPFVADAHDISEASPDHWIASGGTHARIGDYRALAAAAEGATG